MDFLAKQFSTFIASRPVSLVAGLGEFSTFQILRCNLAAQEAA